jgi:hypothetical protein
MGAVTLLADEQFSNLPDAPGKQELLDGELVSLQVPKASHNDISLLLICCTQPSTALALESLLDTAFAPGDG